MTISSSITSTIAAPIPARTDYTAPPRGIDDLRQKEQRKTSQNDEAVKIEFSPQAEAFALALALQEIETEVRLPPLPGTGNTKETQREAASTKTESGIIKADEEIDTIQENEAQPQKSTQGEPTEEQKREIEELKKRDQEVRAHEQAHLSAAGGLATSGARYSYETGPDGKRYAVGGEVSIDVSPGNTPEETITKAQKVRRAALAPAQPSGQDRQVAASATQMEVRARAQMFKGEEQSALGEGAETSGGVVSVDSVKNASSNTVDAAESSILDNNFPQGGQSAVSTESILRPSSVEPGPKEAGVEWGSASNIAKLKSGVDISTINSRNELSSGRLLNITV